MTLDEIKIGTSTIIKSVEGEGALRLRLLDMGLIPGTVVTAVKAAPFGDPIELSVRGYTLTIRKQDASAITVDGGEKG